MFERLQKPFLTVDTGEAYQPIRLTYQLHNKEQLIETLDQLKCLTHKQPQSWDWYWMAECQDLHFESINSYKKNSQHPTRLGTLVIKNNTLYINLPSFKRACLAVPFFHRLLPVTVTSALKADFINKVFGLNERLPHGFNEIFNEAELEKVVQQRIQDYQLVHTQCEQASTAEEAFQKLATYTKNESQKKLPYAERYLFQTEQQGNIDPDVLYLGFYIFLRGRELVAIRRWFGETGYTLADAAEDTVEQVFGDMDIDIIE